MSLKTAKGVQSTAAWRVSVWATIAADQMNPTHCADPVYLPSYDFLYDQISCHKPSCSKFDCYAGHSYASSGSLETLGLQEPCRLTVLLPETDEARPSPPVLLYEGKGGSKPSLRTNLLTHFRFRQLTGKR